MSWSTTNAEGVPSKALGRDTLQACPHPPRPRIRHHVTRGSHAIVVDMRQWFDQLPLADEVALAHDGTPYGNLPCKKLPIGD